MTTRVLAIDPKQIEEWKADRDTVLGSALALYSGARVDRVAGARERLVTAAVCLLREREEMLSLLRSMEWMGLEATCPWCARPQAFLPHDL